MFNWQEFQTDSVQAALYTPDHSAFSSSRALRIVLERFGEEFNGELEVIPIPDDVQASVPRIVLQSADNSKRLNIAPGRVDLILGKATERPEVSNAVRPMIEVLSHYIEKMEVAVGRLGLVVNRFAEVAEPAETLIARFCNEETRGEPLNRSSSFELHNHKIYSPSNLNYDVNSWVRCRSALTKEGEKPIILVTQDINTLAEEPPKRRFATKQIFNFFDVAALEVDDIITKYFPDRG